MPNIRVHVEYDKGTSRQKFLLPADKPVERLLRVMVTKLGLSPEQEDGRRLNYQLRSRETGKVLLKGKTLSEEGVVNCAVLEVVAEAEKADRGKSSKGPTRTIKKVSAEKGKAKSKKDQKKAQQPPPLSPTRPDSTLAEARRTVANAQALLPLKCGKDHKHLQWEDLAVCCPVCGTPYHQQCWSANGNRCVLSQCPGHGSLKSQELSQVISDISFKLGEFIIDLPEDLSQGDEEFFDTLCEVDSNISDVLEAFEEAEFEELMRGLDEPWDELEVPAEQAAVQSTPRWLNPPGSFSSPASLISTPFPDDSFRWDWVFEVGLFLIYAVVGAVLGFAGALLIGVGFVGVIAGLVIGVIVWFIREWL